MKKLSIILAGSSPFVSKVYFKCVSQKHLSFPFCLLSDAPPSSFPIPIKRLKTSNLMRIEDQMDYLFHCDSEFIFPDGFLKRFSRGVYNFHFGSLPEYAGLFCHQWAIINQEKKFYITLHEISSKIDGGKIVKKSEVRISQTDTGLSLYLKGIQTSVNLAGKILKKLKNGKVLNGKPQNLKKRRLYLKKDIQKLKINLNDPPVKTFNLIRAVDYWPFSSPSFMPTLRFKGKEFFLSGVHLVRKKTRKGQLFSSQNKIEFSLSNSKVLIVERMIQRGKVIFPSEH